jgi:hypothetical protein
MLIIICYVNPDSTTAVIFLIVALGLNAGCLIGHTPNHLDLSPNFVAALLGLGNTAACSMSVIGPLLTGFIVTENVNIYFVFSLSVFHVANKSHVLFILNNESNIPTYTAQIRKVAKKTVAFSIVFTFLMK